MRAREDMPKEHQEWLNTYLERKGWSDELDTQQHKAMRNANRQMILKSKGVDVDGAAVLALLRKLPKRLKSDETLTRTLVKLLGILNIDDDLYLKLEWNPSEYVWGNVGFLGLPDETAEVGDVRFTATTVVFTVMRKGRPVEERINRRYYCETVDDKNNYHLFKDGATFDEYSKRRNQMAHEFWMSIAPEDAYGILNLREDATQAEIKASHKKLANKHHPDKGGDPEFMVKLNVARDRLMKGK